MSPLNNIPCLSQKIWPYETKCAHFWRKNSDIVALKTKVARFARNNGTFKDSHKPRLQFF